MASIPVKGYLKKYVYWKENLPDGAVLDLNSQGNIAWVLEGLMKSKLKGQRQEIPDRFPGIYEDTLAFHLTIRNLDRYLISYTIDDVRFFNTFLYRDFHDHLLMLIYENREFGIPEKDTIYNWMETIGIEEMITYDALKKASYRIRKAKNKPLFRCLNCPEAANP